MKKESNVVVTNLTDFIEIDLKNIDENRFCLLDYLEFRLKICSCKIVFPALITESIVKEFLQSLLDPFIDSISNRVEKEIQSRWGTILGEIVANNELSMFAKLIQIKNILQNVYKNSNQ